MALATMVAVAAVVAAAGVASGSAAAQFPHPVNASASMLVAASAGPANASPASSVARRGKKYCPTQPPGGYTRNPLFALPKPPPGSVIVHPPLEPGCADLAGYTDAAKLSSAALVSGEVNVSVEARVAYNRQANYFQEDTYGALWYGGQDQFPPAKATFLTFGFQPATATLILTQIGTLNAVAVGPYTIVGCHHGCSTETTVSSRLSLRLTDVEVNGVPLPVGNRCETEAPFNAILHGSSDTIPPYTVDGGGPLHGTLNIPDFTHCGTGEDLDPLFNGPISGPHNYTLQTQGAVCFQIGHQGCPPVQPKPLRTYKRRGG